LLKNAFLDIRHYILKDIGSAVAPLVRCLRPIAALPGKYLIFGQSSQAA